MIFTSYYGFLSRIPKEYKPIVISRSVPRGLECFKRYEALAPPAPVLTDYLNTHRELEFTVRFQKWLDHLNAANVVKDLYDLAGTEKIVLICYEKPGDFCHRHLVAKWLKKNGFSCEEFPALP